MIFAQLIDLKELFGRNLNNYGFTMVEITCFFVGLCRWFNNVDLPFRCAFEMLYYGLWNVVIKKFEPS